MLEVKQLASKAKLEFIYNSETGELRWAEQLYGKDYRFRGRGHEGKLAGTSIRGRRRVGWLNIYWPSTHIIWLIVYGRLPGNDKGYTVVIDHKDGNPSNDKLDNLEEVSKSEDACRREDRREGKQRYRASR